MGMSPPSSSWGRDLRQPRSGNAEKRRSVSVREVGDAWNSLKQKWPHLFLQGKEVIQNTQNLSRRYKLIKFKKTVILLQTVHFKEKDLKSNLSKYQ